MRGSANSERPVVLVVEDEVLIAMELELRLEALGYFVLGPASSVQSAFDAMDGKAPPSAALLDVQLGAERVTPVARRLNGLGVKFALVTGYARLALEEPEFKDAPRLSKPVTERELKRVLTALVG